MMAILPTVSYAVAEDHKWKNTVALVDFMLVDFHGHEIGRSDSRILDYTDLWSKPGLFLWERQLDTQLLFLQVCFFVLLLFW